MKDHLCICGEVMERKGVFLNCARCQYVYKEDNRGTLSLVKIRGEKPTPEPVGLAWFAKMRATL